MPMALGIGLGLDFGGAASARSLALLGNEPDGLAIDFTDMSATVRDTTTPANAFQGNANDLLTYTSPSTKWIRNKAGLLVSGTTLRTEYDASGVALGVRTESARTNLALHSDDFTQAAWTKSNITAAKTATGPDGVANSASTLTATDANATALQAITSASAARITPCYIRRRTGSGDIDLTQDNGSTWTTVAVTASWTRFEIAAATLANPTVGIRIVESGDEVDVAFFQHEVGAFGTSPIRTAGSTVTRNEDNLTLATSAFPSVLSGTMFGEVIASELDESDAKSFVSLEAAGNGANIRTSVAVMLGTIESGGVNQGNVGSGTFAAGVFNRLAMAYEEDDIRVCGNGGTVNSDVLATMPVQLDTLALRTNNAHRKRILIIPRRMSNTELQALTA